MHPETSPDPSEGAEPGPPGGPRLALKLGIGLGLAGLFLYYFLRGADFRELGRVLLDADPLILLLAFVVSLLSMVVRAFRWRCYLLPVKKVSFRSCFEILLIGYLFLNYLPGRVGDLIVRPLLMGRSERIPKAAALATIAVERLFDTLTVVVFFATYLAFFAPSSLGALDLDRESIVLGMAISPRGMGYVLLLGCALGVAFLAGLRLHQERYLWLLERVLRPLPERWLRQVMAQTRSFAAGLNLFHDLGNAALSMLLSLVAWTLIGATLYLSGRAIDLPIRPVDACLILGLAAIGVAIPTPGGVGSFHVLVLYGLRGLGVTDDPLAQAAAILMWASNLIPVTIVGLIALVRRGVRLGEMKRAAVAQAEAPAEGKTG